MSIPPISSAPVVRGAPARPVGPAPAAGPLDALAPSTPSGSDSHAAIEGIIHRPWMGLPDPLRPLGEVRDDNDAQALAILRQAERHGIWWDGGDSAVVQDLAILRHDLPVHASLVDAASGYERLMDIEKGAHSDPTPHARKVARGIMPTLRAGESAVDAAEAYRDLRRYCGRGEIDASRHALEAWTRIDGAMLDCQSRKVAVAEYIRDPRTFEQRQQQEKTRFEARQAEVKRVVEQVTREPREDLRIEEGADGWLVVGGVRVPRRGA